MRRDIHIVRHYPVPPETLWRALTDPEIVPRWTAVGRGARPEGFSPVVGTQFRYVGKPMFGWDGVVRCEVLEVSAPRLLRYSWKGGEQDDLTTVTNTLEPYGVGGTRFVWDHTGFTGLVGLLVATVLKRVREQMLDEGLPSALASC